MNTLSESPSKDTKTQILEEQEEMLKKLLIVEAFIHSEDNGIPQMQAYVLNDFESIFGIKAQTNSTENSFDSSQSIVSNYVEEISNEMLNYAQLCKGTKESLNFENATQSLCKLIANTIETLKEKQRHLLELKNKNREMLKIEAEQLLKNIEMYHALLISEKFDVFTKHTAEEIATLREQATAINAKLKLLRVEALSETYSPITVNALAKLREQLESAIQKIKNDYALSLQKLEAYRSAGPEFNELAKEYNELKKLEMNKLWAIKQIEESFNAKKAQEKSEGGTTTNMPIEDIL